MRDLIVILVLVSVILGIFLNYGCKNPEKNNVGTQDKDGITGQEKVIVGDNPQEEPGQNTTNKETCTDDSECVPSGCCHPSSCTVVGKGQNCRDSMCSAECRPGTLDCGQGQCRCVNSTCVAVMR